jgi:asparaginyl-tRNA synthetase
LGYAIYQRSETAKFLTRKSVTGILEEGQDASARLEWKTPAKAAMKKAVNLAKSLQKKKEKEKELFQKEQEQLTLRNKVLDEAKQIVLEEDKSLEAPVKIKLDVTKEIKLGNGKDTKGTRVKVLGRVHRERRQKEVMFLTLRDGYGYMQVVFTGDLAKTYDALTLTRETSVEVLGELRDVPAGAHAPLNRELHADYWRVIAKAAGGDDAITNKVAKDTEQSTLLDLRHLVIRGETASKVMIVRDAVEYAFNVVFKELRMRKVSPPAFVQTQVEGGATLFKLPYYNEEAYLTQSSQLYLETCLPSMGDVYCIEKSFRAEKSLTRRHLAGTYGCFTMTRLLADTPMSRVYARGRRTRFHHLRRTPRTSRGAHVPRSRGHYGGCHHQAVHYRSQPRVHDARATILAHEVHGRGTCSSLAIASP